jgi:hypothetical protein
LAWVNGDKNQAKIVSNLADKSDNQDVALVRQCGSQVDYIYHKPIDAWGETPSIAGQTDPPLLDVCGLISLESAQALS